MKVILLEDVKSLGKKGEVVNVSDGYARNFVLPKKLGVEANSANMNDLKLQKANADKVAGTAGSGKGTGGTVRDKGSGSHHEIRREWTGFRFRFLQGNRRGCQRTVCFGTGQKEDPAS